MAKKYICICLLSLYCISEFVRGIDNFFFKLRKYFVRRRPREPPRRRNMTEDEIEMRSIVIGDIATTSHDNVARI